MKISWLIFYCNFQSGNEKFAVIRAGSLSYVAASVHQCEPALRLYLSFKCHTELKVCRCNNLVKSHLLCINATVLVLFMYTVKAQWFKLSAYYYSWAEANDQ